MIREIVGIFEIRKRKSEDAAALILEANRASRSISNVIIVAGDQEQSGSYDLVIEGSNKVKAHWVSKITPCQEFKFEN
jgi:hypothetical protein